MKLFAIPMCFVCASLVHAETHVIEAYSTTFVPDVVNVVPGDTVRFEYVTGYPHTATSGSDCTPDGLFEGSLSGPGDYVEWVVPEDAPAEVPFYCDPHCLMGMTGVINVEHPQGRMVIGIIAMNNPENLEYTEDETTETAVIDILCNGSMGSSYSIGVEIEEADVDVHIVTSGSESAYLLHPASGTETVLTSGTHTLENGERYLFHGMTEGKSTLEFLITFPEETHDGENPNMSGLQMSGIGSVRSSGDSFAFDVSSGTGTLILAGEGDMVLGVLGDVTSPTLTLPSSGTEGTVNVPAGFHEIDLAGLGMLWIPESGGGDDGGLPEDVDGDGVVGVTDLLAIISAWGATSP